MSPSMRNILLILGTTVGAGIFSLPIALFNGGVIPFIAMLIVIAYLTTHVNILYRRVIDHIPERHQLPGYVTRVLGPQAGRIAVFLLLFSTFGALLAYLILGGGFLGNLLSLPSEAGTFIFVSAAIIAIMIDGKKLEHLDSALTICKIILIVTLCVVSVGVVMGRYVPSIPWVGSNPFLAYGAILFAMTGFSIMPELHRSNNQKKTLFTAQTIIFLLYLLFSFSLYPFIARGVIEMDVAWERVIFDIVGLSAVFTPYLLLSLIGVDIFTRDLRLDRLSAKLLVVCMPLLLFALGLQSFTKVLSLTGGVFLGSIAFLIATMHSKLFPGKQVVLVYAIRVIFLLGIVLEAVRFFM